MKTRKKFNFSFFIAVLIMVVFLGFVILLEGNHFLLFSLVCLISSFIPFYWRFENSKIEAREITFLAVLTTIAAVSRVPFAVIPNVQPTSFVIITTGIILGPESGFVVGSTAALVSNMVLGQGPWTPWQMFAWGMMGMTAGFLKNTKFSKNKYLIAGFGFCWGFLFGWIMDLWYLIAYTYPIKVTSFIAAFTSTFYFDLLHSLSNLFFILVLYKTWSKIIARFKIKYGILE